MSKDERYAMVMVRLPEGRVDAKLAERLCGFDVVASFKRPLTPVQVDAVKHAMEGADAYVPGATSGQDAMGLSTRVATAKVSGRFWHNRPKAKAESLLLERLRDIEETTGVRPCHTGNTSPEDFVRCYDDYTGGGKDESRGFAEYVARVLPGHFEAVAEVTPNVPSGPENDGAM